MSSFNKRTSCGVSRLPVRSGGWTSGEEWITAPVSMVFCKRYSHATAQMASAVRGSSVGTVTTSINRPGNRCCKGRIPGALPLAGQPGSESSGVAANGPDGKTGNQECDMEYLLLGCLVVQLGLARDLQREAIHGWLEQRTPHHYAALARHADRCRGVRRYHPCAKSMPPQGGREGGHSYKSVEVTAIRKSWFFHHASPRASQVIKPHDRIFFPVTRK